VCSGDTEAVIGASGTFDAGDTGVSLDVDAGETIVCTFTNTKLGTIIVEKQTNPDGASGSFTFTGDAAGSIGDGGTITVNNLLPGTYTSVESNPGPSFVLTTITCNDLASATPSVPDAPTRTATFKLDPGETVTCTFTNTAQAHVNVVKTVSTAVPPAGVTFDFEIRTGASATEVGTTVASCTTNAAGLCDFGNAFFTPGTSYQFCETNMLPGWHSTLSDDANAFVPNSDDPNVDNSVVCVPFTLAAGETKTFTIDNTPPPGGDARTIGFWKNWTSCDGTGRQDPVLDDTLASAGSLLIGDLLVQSTDVNACKILVDLLDKRDYKAADLLKDGQKLASDPAFNFASQYIAYLLNIEAGAGTCAAATTAANAGQAILAAIDFDGSSADGDAVHLSISPSQKASLNTYAGILDQYNNNNLCP
jgi:hypothetical protein